MNNENTATKVGSPEYLKALYSNASPVVISICALKGGSGKSTTTTGLGAALAADGHKILIVDHDAQGDSTGFIMERRAHGAVEIENLDFAEYAGEDLHIWLSKHLEEKAAANIFYDYVLIDGAPGVDSPKIRSEVLIAHMILVPVQPNKAEVRKLFRLQNVVNEAIEAGLQKDLVLLPTRVREDTVTHREVLKALREGDVPLLSATVANAEGKKETRFAWIRERIAHQDAYTMTPSQTIFEYEPKGEAARDVDFTAKAILKRTNRKPKARKDK